MSISQLALWETKAPLPPLGSTFQDEAAGDNPYMFLGKVGCNYYPGMNIWDELYYWHVVNVAASNGKVIMTCKIIGYAGHGHDLNEDTEEEAV